MPATKTARRKPEDKSRLYDMTFPDGTPVPKQVIDRIIKETLNQIAASAQAADTGV